MKTLTAGVVRVEQLGEDAVPFPTLQAAKAMRPRHREASIRTSADGVVLAEVSADAVLLEWTLTNAGRDADDSAWTAEAPTLSQRDLDTVLMVVLQHDFAVAS